MLTSLTSMSEGRRSVETVISQREVCCDMNDDESSVREDLSDTKYMPWFDIHRNQKGVEDEIGE
jgi:hypothetical protein